MARWGMVKPRHWPPLSERLGFWPKVELLIKLVRAAGCSPPGGYTRASNPILRARHSVGAPARRRAEHRIQTAIIQERDLEMRIDRHLRRDQRHGASPHIPKRPRQKFLEIGKIPSVLRLCCYEGHLPENVGLSDTLRLKLASSQAVAIIPAFNVQ
jgi:hypothetical protein